ANVCGTSIGGVAVITAASGTAASATSTAGGSADGAGAGADAGERGVPRKGTKLRAFGAGRAAETAGSGGDPAVGKAASGTLTS
ncbi:MAG TPA: hypothetical protein DC046_08700, partial [Rhodospirillaceae bacterium]|nr:hypothetical protein [Rhodospirillaceae bacterium]